MEVYDDLFFLQKDLLSKVCIRDLKLQKTHIQRAPDPFSALWISPFAAKRLIQDDFYDTKTWISLRINNSDIIISII